MIVRVSENREVGGAVLSEAGVPSGLYVVPLPEIPTPEADGSGRLVVMSVADLLPFAVRRSYWIHGMRKGERRGGHAHRQLYQGLVALAGTIDFAFDDGHVETYVRLDTPTRLLVVPSGYWRDFTAVTEGAVLLVFASAEYDPADYLHTREDFLKFKGIK